VAGLNGHGRPERSGRCPALRPPDGTTRQSSPASSRFWRGLRASRRRPARDPWRTTGSASRPARSAPPATDAPQPRRPSAMVLQSPWSGRHSAEVRAARPALAPAETRLTRAEWTSAGRHAQSPTSRPLPPSAIAPACPTAAPEPCGGQQLGRPRTGRRQPPSRKECGVRRSVSRTLRSRNQEGIARDVPDRGPKVPQRPAFRPVRSRGRACTVGTTPPSRGG
jgi:hypothetical protein